MGYRLHVHKKHVIEYGERRFNWGVGEVNEFLFHYCDTYHGNSDYFEGDNDIEIEKGDYMNMLAKFDNPETLLKEMEEEGHKLPEGYTLEEFKQCLTDLYNDADPNDDYVHLSWF